MARRYDSRTTTFSPEGRLYQVEYALEAINNASSTIGILGESCVILAADKNVCSKLLEQTRSKEKLHRIDAHVICAVAGLTSDANILIDCARVQTQRYEYTYDEKQPVEQLIVNICNHKQGYTQYGGLRPFGVSFLFGGYDEFHGFQLYHSDPSGNYTGWKATAIGINNQSAQAVLRQDWKENMTTDECLKLAAKVLTKTMETTDPNASSQKLEFLVLGRRPVTHQTISKQDNEVEMHDSTDSQELELYQRFLTSEEVKELMTEAQTAAAAQAKAENADK